MRLNLMTDYALRLLMYLATEERTVSVDEIADAYGISRNHLMKVGQQLSAMGLVTAKRGRGGGLALAVPPEEVSVGAVVRQLESLGGFVECFSPDTNTCRIAGMCGLQGALKLALGDFLKRLDGYTLAQSVPDRHRMASRLELLSDACKE
ncbi:RrF2 family transcriptional regulator [Altererythrobacter sp. Z27]|uniref:RrF2 family transcriptional regulator n=1 Tax=Altererythrobacter sp. Z27 TaxID=3461147 RepID=UPI004044DFAC